MREIYEIALRYGQRTWVQQAVGVGVSNAFDAGLWDEWLDEMRDEEPHASGYYRLWFRLEAAIRMAYEGRIEEADRIHNEAMASEEVQASVQATLGVTERIGEVRMLAGRWSDAYEIGQGGWTSTESSESSLYLSLLAAAGAADLGKVEAIIATISDLLTDTLPADVAVRQVAATLKAVLERRWDDGRHLFVAASRTLEDTGRMRVRAHFQIAVGHLAGERFPEAAEGMGEAEGFFEERGAGAFVAMYRAKAVTPANGHVASASSESAVDRSNERADQTVA